MSPRRDVSMTGPEIQEMLRAPVTGVLTTLGPDGWPHSTGMWFVPGEGSISMWTYAKSQKAVNLRRDPRCAFLVEAGETYGDLRGVLIRGAAEVIDDFTAVRDVGVALYRRYTEPATGIPAEAGPIEEIERQALKRVAVKVPMHRVASWDHRRL